MLRMDRLGKYQKENIELKVKVNNLEIENEENEIVIENLQLTCCSHVLEQSRLKTIIKYLEGKCKIKAEKN